MKVQTKKNTKKKIELKGHCSKMPLKKIEIKIKFEWRNLIHKSFADIEGCK